MLLAGANDIERRRAVAAGPLAPLADSLSDDLDRLLPDEDVFVPREKARMTRRGGRCERDGSFLEFDPRSAHRHRCPMCGAEYEGDEHYRWWIMGYQLWLAERAVHAAALWRVRGTERHRILAEAILVKLAESYASYPDEDNVLGPTRPFFSTYLESIWSLQLSLAVSLLEKDTPSRLTATVRDRILQPSSELIASFDEGLSNRQVWNAAALGAMGTLLGRPALLDHARQTLDRHLRDAMLSDGTWYEGENYHLFAHRGLWHLVRLADTWGANIPREQRHRFELGFVAPLRTALPDFTFPARRDSQYRASLRQWRIAESFELGRASVADPSELSAGLAALYRVGEPGDTARWRSTAEAERNVPPVRLTRADLGWKSLLFALPDEPSGVPVPPASALMEGQGLAVVRGDEEQTYVALDYGHSGGSHGHPDRLNLWLVLGDHRVFEDVGTGSYVEKALHWYRSTLAHNAPLIDGRSQTAVSGTLRAWDERDGYTMIDAEAPIATGVLVRRTVVVGPGHLVDRLEWKADRDVTLDLPMHVDGDVSGADWRPGTLRGESGLEDGFEFLAQSETSPPRSQPVQLIGEGVHGAAFTESAHDWWRAIAPGPPREPERRFLLLRMRGQEGRLISAWSWSGPIVMSAPLNDVVDLRIGDEMFSHRLATEIWHVTHDAVAVMLDGRRPSQTVRDTRNSRKADRPPMVISANAHGQPGARFELGKESYRRTEASWEQAGKPAAVVDVTANAAELVIDISVRATSPNFAPAREVNPLDNEHPDVNSDGIQLHLAAPGHGDYPIVASWLIVPEATPGRVRMTTRGDGDLVPIRATWAPTAGGWSVTVHIPRSALGSRDANFGVDVIVNEMPHGRERRRGQLVLSGGSGWAYLRGDRQDRDALIPMVVRDE
jgi:hypothetical protein